LVLITAGILIWHDHDVAGTVLGTLDLIGLAAVIIPGRRNQD
jgi:hypothetical protein